MVRIFYAAALAAPRCAGMPPPDGYMEIALAEAKMAADAGEVPVGAVVVKDGLYADVKEALARFQQRLTPHHAKPAHFLVRALGVVDVPGA